MLITGPKLRTWRMERNMPVHEACKLFSVSRMTYWRWERDVIVVPIRVLLTMAVRYLGTSRSLKTCQDESNSESNKTLL